MENTRTYCSRTCNKEPKEYSDSIKTKKKFLTCKTISLNTMYVLAKSTYIHVSVLETVHGIFHENQYFLHNFHIQNNEKSEIRGYDGNPYLLSYAPKI